MNRMPEVEHFQPAAITGSGSCPTARWAQRADRSAADAPPDKDTRAGRADKQMMQTEWRPESLQRRRSSSAEAAASLPASRGGVGAIGVRLGRDRGPRTEAQWDEYLGHSISLHRRGRSTDRCL
jgi:aryl-alcohol dehydrogenase (NADP+)